MIDEVLVKGTVVRNLMNFIGEELSHQQIEGALSKLPDDFANSMRKPILLTASHPVRLVNKLTEEAALAKGDPPEAFATRAGRAGASAAVKTVYKLLVVVLTVPALLSKASRTWKTIYSQGDLVFESEEKGRARVFLREFPSDAIGCARITGWMQKLGEMTKARNFSVTHILCSARSAKECEWKVSWGAD